jgi:hypothetical protein
MTKQAIWVYKEKMEDAMKIDEMTLKLCYLFLSVDQTITKDRMSRFEEIGDAYSAFDREKQGIIDICERYISESLNNNRYSVIWDGINEVTKRDSDSALSYSPLSNKTGQKECMWLIVCLAWYDGNCSENEKKIINNLANKWRIEKSVLLEMEDTAITLCEIDKYSSWIKTTNDPYDYVAAVINELNKNQNEITANIFETINDFGNAN